MFRLLRYFSIASLVSIGIAIVLVGFFYRHMALQSLLEMGEEHNEDVTHAFANALWPRFQPLVDASPTLSDEALHKWPDMEGLQQSVRELARGLSMVKIKVYDLRGRTVFSTEARQIGEYAMKNEGFNSARNGHTASELVYRDRFSAFEQVIEKTDLVSSYIPIYRDGGKVVAVFELYDNVTPFVQRIERTQTRVVMGVIVVFAVLYGVLFLIVRHADGVIRRQDAQRRLQQSALEESESRLQRTQYALDHAADMVFWTDPDGRFIYGNETSHRRLGYSPEELLTLSVPDIDPGYPREAWPQIWEALKQQKRMTLETTHRTKWGETYPAEVTVNHVEFEGGEFTCAFARDISRRKEMENRLRTTLGELQVILENAFVGIALVSDRKLVRVNRQLEEMFGYPPGGLDAQPTELLYPSRQNYEQLTSAAYPLLAQGEIYQGEHLLRQKDGTLIWCSVFGRAVDRESLARGVIWILQDITERKRAEVELIRARDAAEAANRAKAQFLANMSHELKTPMNGVVGMTRLALMDEGLAAETRENLVLAAEAADELLSKIDAILDYSEIEAGRMVLQQTRFSLHEVLAKEMALQQEKADAKGLALTWGIADAFPDPLVGDPGRLRQVIGNLVDNAIKFTQQGEVELGVEVERLESDGAELHFTVRDTGVGIQPEKLEAVFDAFTQADSSSTRRHAGTGLGLTIAARLVSLMQGSIWAESDPGRGSTFHFTAWFGRPVVPQQRWN